MYTVFLKDYNYFNLSYTDRVMFELQNDITTVLCPCAPSTITCCIMMNLHHAATDFAHCKHMHTVHRKSEG